MLVMKTPLNHNARSKKGPFLEIWVKKGKSKVALL